MRDFPAPRRGASSIRYLLLAFQKNMPD
jgi:hypothetical protein